MKITKIQYLVTVELEPAHSLCGWGTAAHEKQHLEQTLAQPFADAVQQFYQCSGKAVARIEPFAPDTDATASNERRKNPRFVWLIGSIKEQFPDLPEPRDDGALVLWDRQLKQPAVVVDRAYAQAVCLEVTESAPFTGLESWFNGLSKADMESEGMVGTLPEYHS
jgi:hypothetical protein